jgi:3-oxoacyl-[acyl-carrier protein] reductase
MRTVKERQLADKPLAGHVALVTGAGRGMGQVIARRLADDGAFVIVHYAASRSGADETVATIKAAGGGAIAYQADIANRAEVIALFEHIDTSPGRLDIVVNSSGVSGGGSLAQLDEEQLEWMLGVNLRGPLYIASEAAKRLGEGGRIINIGSSLAEYPIAGSGIYGAVKSALKSFTESWAKELGKQGVTVNTVIPGATSPGISIVLRERLSFQTHRPRRGSRCCCCIPGITPGELGVGRSHPRQWCGQRLRGCCHLWMALALQGVN